MHQNGKPHVFTTRTTICIHNIVSYNTNLEKIISWNLQSKMAVRHTIQPCQILCKMEATACRMTSLYWSELLAELILWSWNKSEPIHGAGRLSRYWSKPVITPQSCVAPTAGTVFGVSCLQPESSHFNAIKAIFPCSRFHLHFHGKLDCTLQERAFPWICLNMSNSAWNTNDRRK